MSLKLGWKFPTPKSHWPLKNFPLIFHPSNSPKTRITINNDLILAHHNHNLDSNVSIKTRKNKLWNEEENLSQKENSVIKMRVFVWQLWIFGVNVCQVLLFLGWWWLFELVRGIIGTLWTPSKPLKSTKVQNQARWPVQIFTLRSL